MRYQTAANGHLQLNVSDDADWGEFERLAHQISTRFGGTIIEQSDGLDQRYWDIQIAGKVITLHLEHYLGISVFAKEREGDDVVKEVGESLGMSWEAEQKAYQEAIALFDPEELDRLAEEAKHQKGYTTEEVLQHLKSLEQHIDSEQGAS